MALINEDDDMPGGLTPRRAAKTKKDDDICHKYAANVVVPSKTRFNAAPRAGYMANPKLREKITP